MNQSKQKWIGECLKKKKNQLPLLGKEFKLRLLIIQYFLILCK